jgi:hypothetical protein
MRTNVVLDDMILAKAQKLAQAKTKRETIDVALREYLANHSRKDLRELAGRIEFWEDYDYKSAPTHPLTTCGAVHIHIPASHRIRLLFGADTLPLGD